MEKIETTAKFNTLGIARSFTYHAAISLMIILGDDELFWAVTPAQAARLLKQGYELAR